MSTEMTTAMREPSGSTGSRMAILFGSVGAVVEWYDFMLYAYLAPIISRLFFPTDNVLTSLIATYGIFWAGYFMRPLGGIFFGRLGDRWGRKKTLTLSVTMMAVPMAITGLLPTYAEIGMLAVVLMTAMRLLQGFSVGGEYSGTLVLLTENATDQRRGFIASFAAMTAAVGMLLASLVVTIMTSVLSTEQQESFGWRLLYFFGFGIVVLAFIMRQRMEETPQFRALQATGQLEQQPLLAAIRRHLRAILICAALEGYAALAFYLVLAFLPTYLESVIGVPHAQASAVTTFILVLWVVFMPLFGWLSDKQGRKPPMIGAALALAAVAFPAFWLLARGHLGSILVAEVALVLPLIAFHGANNAALTELFPTKDRYSGMGVGYNLGNAIFGGSAPLVATTLIHLTGSELAPAGYLLLASVLIVFVIWRMRETARVPFTQV